MILYYDNLGKLNTIIPHGEIPRQGDSEMDLYIYFDKTYYNTNYLNSGKNLYVRYKFEEDFNFGPDEITSPISGIYEEFSEIDSTERIGSLINGNEYAVHKITISNINKAGKMSLVFNWKQVQNTTVLSELYLGKAEIYIEETLGFAPDVGLGMTRTEYEALMIAFNGLVTDISNKADRENASQTITAGTIIVDKVTGLSTPISNTDATNKKYVDDIAATKVDKTTTVNGYALSGNITLGKTDVGLGNVENKGLDLTPTLNSSNYVTSNGVYAALQNVLEVAEGKTKNYVISNVVSEPYVNSLFNNNSSLIMMSSSDGNGKFKDYSGNDVNLSDLKVGDIISIVETDVPDRWVMYVSSGSITFGTLEIKFNFDATPTQGSTKLVMSGDIYDFVNSGLALKQNVIDSSNKLDADLVDDTASTHKFVSASEKAQITSNENAISGIKDGQSIDSFSDVETALGNIQNGTTINNFSGVESALSSKQNALTFDTTPTQSSNNPVTSGGVYNSIQNVLEIAEGKTKNYVIHLGDNNISNPNSNTAYIPYNDTLHCIGNIDVPCSQLKIGDIISIIETDYPDRWVYEINVLLNKIKLAPLEIKLDFDLTPTQNSSNPVTSGGIYSFVMDNPNITQSVIDEAYDESYSQVEVSVVSNDITFTNDVISVENNDIIITANSTFAVGNTIYL